MEKLYIVGCGAAAGDVTLKGAEALDGCAAVVLHTEKIELFSELSKKREVFACDDCYEQAEDFDGLNRLIWEKLCSFEGSVCFAVTGSALEDECAAFAVKAAKENGIPAWVIPGVSLAEAACACAGITGEKRVLTAFEAEKAVPEAKVNLCVTGIDDALLAGRVKCRLADYYADEQEIYFFNGSAACGIPLCELDRRMDYGHRACAVIPAVPFEKRACYNTEDLLYIMRRLRDVDGCPWDREQTHETLTRYLVEEAYEVADAVNNGDPYQLADELGDVLLQVAFHAQIGSEHGEFSYRDVTDAVCRKMIRRHPHVFADTLVSGSDEVLTNWEAIKRRDRGQKDSQVLAAIPGSFPALMRAEKVLDKARHAGLDISAGEAAAELDGAVSAVKAMLEQANSEPDTASRAVGEMLLRAANAARKCSVQPEMALNCAVDRFISRFERTERAAEQKGTALREADGETVKQLWRQAEKKDD